MNLPNELEFPTAKSCQLLSHKNLHFIDVQQDSAFAPADPKVACPPHMTCTPSLHDKRLPWICNVF